MSKLLKHEIDSENIKNLAVFIQDQQKTFDIQMFEKSILDKDWDDLALKQRIRRVSECINNLVAGSYRQQVEVLKPVSIKFKGLFHLIFADFVELYGLDDFETSLDALELFTQNSSAEFAIRPFINRYPEKTKQRILSWIMSDNEHLRRLASEGVRPRLPWATHLNWIAEDPEWVKPILLALKTDKSKYVQKSVANLLNDLTKSQPEWVLRLIQDWDTSIPETAWIVKHALRTLLKRGDPRALERLGYAEAKHVQLQNWQQASTVSIGQKLHWSFELKSNQPLGLIRLEYAVSFLRKKQQPYRKVFKIGESEIAEQSRLFDCSHNFKIISTRQYYPGRHQLELIVNGRVVHITEFELV